MTFDTTVGDLAAPSELVRTRSVRQSRWFARMYLFGISIATTLACIAGAGALTAGSAIVSSVLTAVAAFVFAIHLFPDPGVTTRRYLASRATKFSNPRRTVTLDVDGVRTTSDFGELFITWNGFTRIARTEQHPILFTRLASAIAVPRRAFATVAEFTDFATVAQSRAVLDIDNTATGGFPVVQIATRSNAISPDEQAGQR